jgi:hypothetical protein
VNKEWEHSHKRGFKCTFERGILRARPALRRLERARAQACSDDPVLTKLYAPGPAPSAAQTCT